ncbi:MAG: hypothetical protein HKN26_07470 [Acidimicrobiales bacterium]|nr:hypothetical protein [Acidimicrobiales bacterium]
MARFLFVLIVVAVVSAGCGSDFEEAAVALERNDHGWLVSIDPDEKFDIGLVGNALYPEARWQLSNSDPRIVALDGEEHEELGQDRDDLTGDQRPTVSIFHFSGVELGETALAFELLVDGERVAVAEYTIAVVDEACVVDIGIVANRCGRTIVDQPQALTELDHGYLVALEPGDTLDVMLTGNPQYPAAVWHADEVDASVVNLRGPMHVPASRQPGDWDPGSEAAFLPKWTFTIDAAELGRSRLVFDLLVDGRRVDLYSVTIDVVEDACAVPSNQSSCRS